jgi:TP901 family phage tail tape measure protein
MADIQSDIKVNIDTSSALASIKNLQRQISAFQSAMAKGSAANSAAAQNLQKDLLQNINATGKFAASMTNVKTTTESFTNSLEKNKFSMGEYFRYAGGASKTFSKFFKGEFETINKVARERVKDLQTQYVQLGRDANGAMRAMKVRPLSLDLEDLGTKTQIAAQRQQLFNQLLKQGSTNLLNWGKNTQWAGRQLMVGFTIPLAVFGSMASKTFMDLEKQAIRFKRVYGDAFSLPADADKAVKEMQELASEFTKYGIAIEKTMELAADAAQMGLTGSALNAQVREATRLAVLGEVEQQEALTATISVTNAFGVAAEDLAKKIDFLNAVENETVTSINDLTIAIPKAGPVVKQLGGDVEDLAFFLTAMKEGGINASEGANALKSGLASLINPTKVSSEFLQKLGINIAGIVEANKGDVKGVVIDFAEALDTLDPLNRARAIEQLFGKFQFSRISTLFQNVIAEGNQAQRVLELANASTSELALLSERELGKVAESTTFKYEKAIQDFRMALAPVGEEFLKAITPIIEFGTSLIKQFNNMDAGVKGFVTNITLLFAGVGPVLLMTVGLLANGIANIIKGAGAISQLFQRLKGGPGGVASEISYMTQEQMEALAVAASLDQVHSKLQQTFTSEKLAIDALTLSYQRAVAAQRAFGLPPTIRAAGSVAPQMYASGTVKVPGPKGAGDVVPAMLSPGEAVIPADQAEKYRGFISSMIAGKVPGFANGVMLGMPRSAKSVSKNREAADAIYQEFLKSSYANVPPTEYGHQIAPTSGHSFPIFGLGGVYSKAGGKQVFVKPVMDETAALAEIRGTQIARQAHGLEAPEQRIVVIRDPLDSTRQRRFLALESDLDAKFIQNQPKAVFNEEQYFRQLVASLVRVDKDLAAANVFGNVVADVGPAGVFDRASGVRTLKTDLPSMEEQALVNLLGIKGGAKRAFAESTLALMASMTPQQYHQYMIAEIQRVLPALKQTVAGFGLSNPSEIDAYDAMIKRLEIGLGVDWSKFHAVHSAVKIAVPKAPKAAPVPGYANGVVSVPGPKGKGDVVPAMLSPGEAVIPAGMAKKYAPLINGMISGNIPGYMAGRTVDGRVVSPGITAERSQAEIDRQISVVDKLRQKYSMLSTAVPNIFTMIETAVDRVAQSGERLSATRADEMLKSIAGQLLPIAKATAASGTDISGSLGGVNLAHLTPKITVTAEQAHQLALELEALGHAGHATTLKLKNATGEISLYSNLVANLPQPGNFDRLTGNQMAQWFSEEADFNGTKMTGMDSFLMPIAANYNIDPNDPELREFGNRLVASFLQAGNRAVTDTDIYQMVFEVINSMTESAAKRAVVAASQEFRTVGDNSGDARRPSLPAGTFISAEADFVPGEKSLSATDASIRTDPLSNKGYRDIRSLPGMKEFVANSNQLADNFVTSLAQDIATEIESRGFPQIARVVADEVEDGLGISSPSAEYAGISNAVTAGVRTATDDAAAAGQEVGATAARNIEAGASAGAPGVFRVPGSRRATTNPELAAMPAGTQTGGPRVPRRATAPQQAAGGPDQTGLMAADGMMLQIGASAGRASTEIDELGKTAKKGGVGLLGYGGIVSNLTFGATALAGAMSTVGGEIGAFGQEIFKVSGFIFAATSIIQAFTQMKVLELAATRMAVAKQAMAFATYGTGISAGKGFAGMLARGVTGIGAFLGPIGIATIAIGAMVAGIYLVNKAREEEKARIEGLGKVANLAADKIQKLAGIFGITPTPSPIDTATFVPGVSAVERVEANEVRASEGFAEDYAAELNAIRAGAQKDVELALQFLSVKLSGMGFESGMIDTIVDALILEAERTDVSLNFKSIDVGTKDGIEQSVSAIQQAANEVNAGAASGKTGTNFFAAFDKEGRQLEGTFEDYFFTPGVEIRSAPTFTEEFLTKMNTLSQGLASTVSGLSSAFAKSSINIDEFTTGMDGVSEAISGIEDESARGKAFNSFLEGMRTETNTDFIDGLQKIAPTADGIADAMILIKAQAGGLALPQGIAEDFAAVSSGVFTEEQYNAVTAAKKKFNDELRIELQTQKDINDTNALNTATEQLDAELLSLQESVQKKKEYEAAGLNAAEASAVFGDAMLATALDAAILAGNSEDVVNTIKKILKLRDQIQGRTTGGGAPQKGPFEDLLSSLKKIADKSVNVKGGIDEIFKLFGKNRNIRFDRGFESLFVKGNFNASFAKFLSDAEAKTRELLVRFKNGKAILTEFGLAVQKAFQANSLATFRQELRISMQSIQDQRTAVKVLTENNIGYAEAVKIASNAEAAAAIATASRKKNGKDLADVLKLIRREQKLQLILQGEQEIADKKQSKIQETKDMLEGVREQIREYNKLSKAQEQLSKSNFTLIEQQAILRDPVLITMYLDGLEPELLKAKLKEAVSPEFMQGIFEEGFNNAMAAFSANEEKLDIELRIKTKGDEGILRKAQKDIAAISFRIDDLEADLTRLEIKEEEISSIYDKRIEALEEIKSINDDLVDQQDKQLTIADALSQGDISAAAKAAQDLRASQAARSIDIQTEALEKSRETELAALRSANGKSRAEIEKIIKDLQMEIFEIEESRLEPAQRRVDLATEEKEELAESFTVLGRTKLEWDSVASKITSAKVQSDLYKSSIEQSIGMVNDLATAWSTVKPTNPVIPFPETPKSEAVLAAEAAAAKEAEDAKKDKEEDKKPKPKPKPAITTSAPAGPTASQLAEEKERKEQQEKNNKLALDLQKQRDNAQGKLDELNFKRQNLNNELAIAQAAFKVKSNKVNQDKVKRVENLIRENSIIDEKQRTPLTTTIRSLDARIKALRQFAVGGFVSGPGTPTSDSIPALLSDGEYVIKAASVNKFGKGFLDNINAGKLPGYKKGGMINADRIDDARDRARAKKAKEWEEKVFKDGLTSKELKKERELVARQESEARKQSALNKVRSDARRLESQQAAVDAQRQANPTILDKILDMGAKLSPLIAMQQDGVDIGKSLFNLGTGKATTNDALTLGLSALGIVPGGKIAKSGSKMMNAIRGFLPAPKGIGVEKLDSVPLRNPNLSLIKNILTRKNLHGGKDGKPFDVSPEGNPENFFGADFFTTPSKSVVQGYKQSTGALYNVSMPLRQAAKLKILDLTPGAKAVEDQFPGLYSKLSNSFDVAESGKYKGDHIKKYLNSPNRHTLLTENKDAAGILHEYGVGAIRHQSGGPKSMSEVFAFISPQNMRARPLNFKNKARLSLSGALKSTGLKQQETMSVEELSNMYSKEFGKAGSVSSSYWVDKGLMSQKELDQLRSSIARDGIKTPLQLDNVRGTNVLVDGHHRLAIAKELGIKNLPIRRANGGMVSKYFAMGGMVNPKYFANGGMVKLPRREPPPVQMAGGGIVPKYFNVGGMVKGYAKGGDVVPSMLTPGEFVMSKYAVESFGADKMKAINNGTYSSDSVYNYSINVNVQTGANANDIARNVMTEIRRIDSQKIRGNRF